ncbi:hypothetical protein ACIGHG_11120 [Bacillus sp. NPDC077411]|uniref:hypothetical protein n=1 Tax=Bacillus sp. NPDC077411 TaxID=3363947 RepID=UPI0037C5FD66
MKLIKKKYIYLVLVVLFLSSLIFLFFKTKESKIKDFPVPMSAIYIKEDKPGLYQYYSIFPIKKAEGWKSLGENGHTLEFIKGNRKVIIFHFPEDNNYYLYEEK